MPQPHFYWTNSTNAPPLPDIDDLQYDTLVLGKQEFLRRYGLDQPEEGETDMAFTNDNARDLAREILNDKTRGKLRETVEQAIEHLQALIAETSCGSTLTFKKTNDDGKHYFYAAVKNGDQWFTTARDPRVLTSDDQLIEWLIGLEIWEAPQLEITESKHSHALTAGEPIDSTAVES